MKKVISTTIEAQKYSKNGFQETTGLFIYGAYAIVGPVFRVIAIVIYFSVPLGLFNLLTHWVYETVDLKWREFEYDSYWDGTLDYEKPIKFAIYDETQQKYNQIYLKNISKELLTKDPYEKYTGLTLGWYYTIFICGVVCHVFLVSLLDVIVKKHIFLHTRLSRKYWITPITNAFASL